MSQPDDLDFDGKTVLVVGGSSGIGNGIAQAFLRRGAAVHVWGTRKTAADYSADEGSVLGGLHYQQLDVQDREALDAYTPPFEALDVLVQSQGLVLYRRAEFNMADFSRVLGVNLMSVMACALKFRELLARRHGTMIVINSIAAYLATKGNPAYNASKAGVLGLTRNLAQAWAADGIRVNGIAPGLVDTKLTRVTTQDPARLARTLERIPLGRLGTVEEMAGVALFLASPLSSYMTGQTLLVDGGRLL
jgi:3-oxoacyl-[acyl-carrier protein] reductase